MKLEVVWLFFDPRGNKTATLLGGSRWRMIPSGPNWHRSHAIQTVLLSGALYGVAPICRLADDERVALRGVIRDFYRERKSPLAVEKARGCFQECSKSSQSTAHAR